jgi:hypothetical protein
VISSLSPDTPPHDCRYLQRLLWTGWARALGSAGGLEERLGRLVRV